MVTVARWTCSWQLGVSVTHVLTGFPQSFPVDFALGLVRLLEPPVGVYSRPRIRDALPSGVSWDEHTSIRLGAFPGSESSTNDPSYPRWCASVFQGPSGSLSLSPLCLGVCLEFASQYRGYRSGCLCARSDVGRGGGGEHSAECLRCGVCVRLVAQLAELSDPCPCGPFKDRLFAADRAAL